MSYAVGFDLDNTLYDQGQHMRSFLHSAAQWLQLQTGLQSEAIEACLCSIWEEHTSYYPYLFDDALRLLDIWCAEYVRALVCQYHSHRTHLTLYPGVRDLLGALKERYLLFLVTDGNSRLQWNKISTLHLSSFFSLIVCTGDYGKDWYKPSTKPFALVLSGLGLEPDRCLYVGDNPMSDFEGARAVGMRTARVMAGPFSGILAKAHQRADYSLYELSEIWAFIGIGS